MTESIDLHLSNFEFKYFSEKIPENIEYEKLNYSDYLREETAYRTAIYSKTKFFKKYPVLDNKTSLALEYQTDYGNVVFYATIIGTRYKEKPFADNELYNCIKDCKKITEVNPNLIIVGDLNTSFLEFEKDFIITTKTTESLKKLLEDLNLVNITKNISENIDHIIIPKKLENYLIESKIFVDKTVLSDHQGIFITLA